MSADDKAGKQGAGIMLHRKIRRRREDEAEASESGEMLQLTASEARRVTDEHSTVEPPRSGILRPRSSASRPVHDDVTVPPSAEHQARVKAERAAQSPPAPAAPLDDPLMTGDELFGFGMALLDEGDHDDPFGEDDDPFGDDPFAEPPARLSDSLLDEPEEEEEAADVRPDSARPLSRRGAVLMSRPGQGAPPVARDRETVEFPPPAALLDDPVDGAAGLESAEGFFDEDPAFRAPSRPLDDLDDAFDMLDPFAESVFSAPAGTPKPSGSAVFSRAAALASSASRPTGQRPSGRLGVPTSPHQSPSPIRWELEEEDDEASVERIEGGIAAPKPPEPPLSRGASDWDHRAGTQPRGEAFGYEEDEEEEDDPGIAALFGRSAPGMPDDAGSILELTEEHAVESRRMPPPSLSRVLSRRSPEWQREVVEEVASRLAELEQRLSSGPPSAGAPGRSSLEALPPGWGTLDAERGVITAGIEITYEVDGVLRAGVAAGADAVLLVVGARPALRWGARTRRLGSAVLTEARWEELLRPLCPASRWAHVMHGQRIELEHSGSGAGRWRVAVPRRGVAICVRQHEALPGLFGLGLPRPIEGLVAQQRGVMLITSPFDGGAEVVAAALASAWAERHGGRTLVIDPAPRLAWSGEAVHLIVPGVHVTDAASVVPIAAGGAASATRLIWMGARGAGPAREAVELAWSGGLTALVVRAWSVQGALDALAEGDEELRRELCGVLTGAVWARRVPLREGGEGIVAGVATIDAALGDALAAREDIEARLVGGGAGEGGVALTAELRRWVQQGWCDEAQAARSLIGCSDWFQLFEAR